MADALDTARQELYRVDPSEFVHARDERVNEAREKGDEKLARALAKLRRPTIAAWAVNGLRAREGGRLDELLDLGEKLRSAQRDLRAEDLRELDRQRSALVQDLAERAATVSAQAGRPLGDNAQRQVEETLRAALSDPDSARAVSEGTLEKPLSYSGFGLDELSTKVVSPGRERKSAGRKGKVTGQREAELRQARADLQEAERELRHVEQETQEGEKALSRSEQRRTELRAELDELGQEVQGLRRAVSESRRHRDRLRERNAKLHSKVSKLESR